MTKKMIYIARMPRAFGYGYTAADAVRACLPNVPTPSTKPPKEPLTLDKLLNLVKVREEANWEISNMDGSLMVPDGQGEIEQVRLFSEDAEEEYHHGEWEDLKDFLDEMTNTRNLETLAALLPHMGLDPHGKLSDALDGVVVALSEIKGL